MWREIKKIVSEEPGNCRCWRIKKAFVCLEIKTVTANEKTTVVVSGGVKTAVVWREIKKLAFSEGKLNKNLVFGYDSSKIE